LLKNKKKMRKIIFLDIDGVIAVPTPENVEWGLVGEKQNILRWILEKTDAEIVLSSSWRMNTVDETKEYMTSQGFLFSDKIIGVTIRAYSCIKEKVHLSIPRGVEINQWIDTHIHSDNGKNWERKKLGKDYTYVILDDDSDMLLCQKDNFIQTHPMEGLSWKDARKAVKILTPLMLPN
jgi:hypothetical protein